jgi:uncharacterized membrane protein
MVREEYMTDHIQSPFEWGWDRLKVWFSGIGSTKPEEYWPQANLRAGVPDVRRIGLADLRIALARGFDDFGANRDDVVFLCVAYPVIGLVLGRLAFGYGLLPMLFPLAAGFTLIGPLAAIGLNEMSRRREQGAHVTWMDVFGVLHSPSLVAIAQLGALLLAIFALWLVVADSLYNVTLGPEPPVSISAFAHDVFTTDAGWVLIGTGMGIGFLFAVVVLATSVVSFPLLLDRPVSVATALRTSIRAVLANPGTMAIWGLIIAGGLVIGSIPFFLGLTIVMPVLGHATWHLYRRVVEPA